MSFFSIGILIVVVVIALRISPREKKDQAQIHGAGQIAMLAALALFGADFFTSYFYGTGELMSVLWPYGLQKWGYIGAGVIAFANICFGILYMYSLAPFNEGGGSYTASMRYLKPTLSLMVAVTLIEDYVLTIVVSALSGSDQLLSITNSYGTAPWYWHFAIGAVLAAITWYLTIRGRGESAFVSFALLAVFFMLTIVDWGGLIAAVHNGVAAAPAIAATQPATVADALYHLLTGSMKGMVALTGLEAMSNGIQFVINEDVPLVKWGKKQLPRLNKIWSFYSGKTGVGRFVQTAFLFYGGATTIVLTGFAIHFNVFDGTLGRTLVGNLAWIGFGQIPGGTLLYWVYQSLAVVLLAIASMTAFQDAQATEWRDVAIGEIPEVIIYRDKRGTFTRSVTITFGLAVIIMLLVKGRTDVAAPFYGVGVFIPITIMGLAMRQHILRTLKGWVRRWGGYAALFVAILAASVWVFQIIGKWEEGGWVRLISFSVLFISAHLVILSPLGYRDPKQIHRIVRDKARIRGAMASIVEWQALKMQEYRYSLLVAIARFWQFFGVNRPVRYDPPAVAGDYNEALHVDHPDAKSLLEQYLDQKPTTPKVGGAPRQTAPGDEEGKEE
ncbi:MAG: hypothetical protein ABSA23_14640 [Anaerolineales bacterium]|jgi:hypothetical protein